MPFRRDFDLCLLTVSCHPLTKEPFISVYPSPGYASVQAAPVGAYNKWIEANISRMSILSCTRGPLDFSGTYDSHISPITDTNADVHMLRPNHFNQPRLSSCFASLFYPV